MTYFRRQNRLSRRGEEKPQKFVVRKLIEIRTPYVRNLETSRAQVPCL